VVDGLRGLDAVHVGHLDVGDDQVRGGRPTQLDQRLAGRDGGNLVPGAGEVSHQDVAVLVEVLGDRNA
jgi:hypothetical protein